MGPYSKKFLDVSDVELAHVGLRVLEVRDVNGGHGVVSHEGLVGLLQIDEAVVAHEVVGVEGAEDAVGDVARLVPLVGARAVRHHERLDPVKLQAPFQIFNRCFYISKCLKI